MKYKSGFSNIQIEEMGSEVCEPLHSYGPAVRNYYLFHIVIKGKGKFHYDNQVVEIFENQIFMIKPDEVTYYEADELEPWSYMWFGISGESAKRMVKSMGFSDDRRVVTIEERRDNFLSISQRFVHRRLEHESDHLLEMSDFYYIVSLMSKNAELLGSGFSEIEIDNRHIQIAMEYIKKNYLRQITIQDVSDFVGVDRTQLFRLFQNTFRIGPQEYLIDLRMKKAEELLLSSDLPIRIIAFSVGYGDHYHFSKIFKKRKGFSPGIFRKRRGL